MPESSFDSEKEYTDWQRNSVLDVRKNLAERIYNELISDLRDRSGLGNEYDAIDEDIKAELQKTWKEIIVSHLETK